MGFGRVEVGVGRKLGFGRSREEVEYEAVTWEDFLRKLLTLLMVALCCSSEGRRG